LVNARFVRPIDTVCLEEIARTHPLIVTAEDNVLRGGFGEACADYLMKNGYRNDLLHIGVPDSYVTHGTPDQLYRMLGMDAESIAKSILEKLQQED
jgi:1-deoxy-D-xylulose-5-phosphate synthase